MEVFKKGQLVTRRSGGNASGFNTEELGILGASSLQYDNETIFEIEGTVKLITFDHNPRIYGAYLLKRGDKNVGYVYNTYIDEVSEQSIIKKELIELKRLKLKYEN
jgi:hypothetical protein